MFKAQGIADPQPRIRMLDGESGSIKVEVELETVLKGLVERSN